MATVTGSQRLLNITSTTIEAYTTSQTEDAIVTGDITAQAIAEFADNAAAIAGGLAVNTFYRTGDFLKIVH
jgi:hypothetical protein